MHTKKNTMFKKIIYPILFQGNLKKRHYFEGWYYKQVSKDQRSALSLIPGISLFPGDEHSFIQYIYVHYDENNREIIDSGYKRFSIESFKFCNDPFFIKVGENTFSESIIFIKLMEGRINIQGTIKLKSITPIKKSIVTPNIMGFFAYIPNMECYHGVISMNHSLNGTLSINNKKIDFSNGKGYIEKDWGTSFPKKYIWIQCNNFKQKDTSIFCSIAHIPFFMTSFKGFICDLLVNGKEYRFATYNNSKVKIKNITDKFIAIILENNEAILKIEGKVNKSLELVAPKKGNMEKIIKEGMAGEVSLKLYTKKEKLTYEDIGVMAGIEIVE